ncbi:S8 family serine peptidase [Algirhabdus cladophorae]|uniref:S8 family serine peptidase n=1 Tax=Algirhabdus cladophorae TaxID=3377108 RepID=UPI003B846C0E
MTQTTKPTLFALKRKFMAVALFATLAGCGLAPYAVNSQAGAPALAETGRVYALTPDADGPENLRRSAQDLGYEPDTAINLPALGLVMVPVDIPQDVTGKQAIDALEDAVPGSTVGVNHAYQLQATAASTDRRTFANSLINWPTGGCRAVTAIGLIDGGVAQNALSEGDTVLNRRNFVEPSAGGLRHGTETASVLADPSRMKNVVLYSANVVTRDKDGFDQAGAASIVEALNWLVASGVRVANVSLAGPPNKLLAQAVDAASARGLVLVAAAGNDRRVAALQYPAALPSVVAVTAVDARQKIHPTAVRGGHIDFAAPGVDIFVGAQDTGRFVSGTSLAAPFVSALLATQTETDPKVLVDASVDLGRPGKDSIFGHGLIQADAVCGG